MGDVPLVWEFGGVCRRNNSLRVISGTLFRLRPLCRGGYELPVTSLPNDDADAAAGLVGVVLRGGVAWLARLLRLDSAG